MLEKLVKPTDETLRLSLNLDVQEHLKLLRTWQDSWKEEDKRIALYVASLDGNNMLHVQMGAQAKVQRTYNRLMLVQQPLEISDADISQHGAKNLRMHLVAQFRNLSKPSRKRWLQNFLFIMVPELRELYNKIARIRSYSSLYTTHEENEANQLFGTLGQQRNFLLGGPSGMGKTTTLDFLIYQNSPYVGRIANHVPIVKIDAPVSNNSVKRILQQLILRCGKTYLKRLHEDELHDLVTLYFQQCQVEAVIVDEIQHLKTQKMRRHLLEISNNNRGIPFICASCNPLEFTQGDEEITGRWNDYFPLKEYDGKRLGRLLGFIELMLPLDNPSNLGKSIDDVPNEVTTLIEKHTKGILKDIMILLVDATLLALDRGEHSLSPEILNTSWANIQKNGIDDFLTLLDLREE